MTFSEGEGGRRDRGDIGDIGELEVQSSKLRGWVDGG
jgi:hypothetical protein